MGFKPTALAQCASGVVRARPILRLLLDISLNLSHVELFCQLRANYAIWLLQETLDILKAAKHKDKFNVGKGADLARQLEIV